MTEVHEQETRVREIIRSVVGDDKKIIDNLFKGVYKYAKKNAKDKGVNVSWDNENFLMFISDVLRRVMVHIDKKSHIYEDVDKKNRIKIVDNGKKGIYVKPKKIASMTHQELNPELWESIYKEMRDKEEIIEARERGEGMVGVDSSFKCRKCGSKNVLVTVQQLRSADEGSTGQYTCNDCGNRWNK